MQGGCKMTLTLHWGLEGSGVVSKAQGKANQRLQGWGSLMSLLMRQHSGPQPNLIAFSFEIWGERKSEGGS